MKKARQQKGEQHKPQHETTAQLDRREPGDRRMDGQDTLRPRINFYNDGSWPPGREPRR